ncbi:hypothetical protein ACJMK2_014387 [Sinanodonta woodiana]|uniref:Band 3 cytoplasmic domain-containing protein n=1 Tax=Sinanodonta woodiana TaxID=1069815 RepID=A0ABD3V196_SINWO
MVELDTKGETAFWKETARWIKFEEDVDEGGGRWSKPHVATLSLHSLFELRSCIMTGTVILDMDAEDLSQVIDLALDNMVAAKQLEENLKEQVHATLLLRHQHQNERHLYRNKDENSSKINLPIMRSFADISRKFSEPRLNHHNNGDKEELTPVCMTQNFQETQEIHEVGGGIEQSHSGILRNASSCDLRESASTHKVSTKREKKEKEKDHCLVSEPYHLLSSQILDQA